MNKVLKNNSKMYSIMQPEGKYAPENTHWYATVRSKELSACTYTLIRHISRWWVEKLDSTNYKFYK